MTVIELREPKYGEAVRARRARCTGRTARGRGATADREDSRRKRDRQAGPQSRDHSASMTGLTALNHGLEAALG